MEQITLRVPENVLEEVEQEAEESNRSRSEYLRNVIRARDEHAEEVEELQEKVDELQTELDRVRREKRQILEQREEKRELVRYVDDEIEWRAAPLTKRIKWWVTGKPE